MKVRINNLLKDAYKSGTISLPDGQISSDIQSRLSEFGHFSGEKLPTGGFRNFTINEKGRDVVNSGGIEEYYAQIKKQKEQESKIKELQFEEFQKVENRDRKTRLLAIIAIAISGLSLIFQLIPYFIKAIKTICDP